MKQYEAPKLSFEELVFFEKIAETCWGSKTVTFDYPYEEKNDPLTPDPIPEPLILGSGCGNQSSSVLSWLQQNLTQAEYDYWLSMNSNQSSNLANTRMSGINVIPS